MSKLIILTGKTASGKDTIKAALLKKYPQLKKITTTTSRKIRSGEKDGADYYFITREEFEKKIKNGDFLEYVEYGGNLYGTEKKELLDALNHHDLIWKIDPSRAGEIRDFIKRAFSPQVASDLINNLIVIYITTSNEVILERLRKRYLSDKEIAKRMNDDQRIWHEFKDKYDFVVENVPGKLERSVKKMVEIIESHQK